MRRRNLTLTLVVVLCLTCHALAGKKGGGTTELDYNVVILTGVNDARSRAVAISEPRVEENSSLDGSIYVCGKMAVDKEESPVRIGLWRIDRNGIVADTVDHGEVLDGCWAVNNRGIIVGDFQNRPAVLTSNGVRIDLPIPQEATNGWANAITDPDADGLVTVVGGWGTGSVYDGTRVIAGRQWFVDAESNQYLSHIDLGDFDLPDFNPIDINQQGDMVGSQATWGHQASFENIAAWMFAPNVWLPESLSEFVDVNAIDEEGNIVGNWRSENTNNQGVVLLADGTLINLTELGRRKTEAHDIATVDGVVQVVGYTDDSSGLGVGYVWTNGQLIELDKLVGSGQAWIGQAVGINSSGAICGGGQFGSRRQRKEYAYLLLPKTAN